MTSTDTARDAHPIQALFWGVGAIILFLAARPILAQGGLIGNAVAQWGFLAVPVVAAVTLSGLPVAETLGFRRVNRSVLAGATLVTFGALALNGVVAWLQSFVLPVPVETLERMSGVLAADSVGQWMLIVATASVTPAICEEIVFRGILLEPFRRSGPGWLVVGLGSLMFGLMHWMPGTWFRVLPAAFSGAMIGWMVWATRSLWTGVWMHLVNNTLLLTAAAAMPAAMPDDPSIDPNPATVILGLAFVVLGARWALSATPASPPTFPSTDSPPEIA